ncbi:hypothetical protein Hanom_Chr05g00448611 [Helianthus anomalus]
MNNKRVISEAFTRFWFHLDQSDLKTKKSTKDKLRSAPNHGRSVNNRSWVRPPI